MNIFNAISGLLYRADATLSGRQKDDRLILEMAIVFTLFSPLLSYIATRPYQGDLPPVAPIAKEIGIFATKKCPARSSERNFCVFRSSTGELLPVEYIKEYSGIRGFVKTHGDDVKLEVQGFYLINGKGKYWLTKVSTLSGEELLSEVDSYSKLKSMRSMDFLLSRLYIVAVVLWSISIRSALRFDMRRF